MRYETKVLLEDDCDPNDQVPWTAFPWKYERSILKPEDKYVYISAMLTREAGVDLEGDCMYVYRHQGFNDQWDAMARVLIETHKTLWIYGPPNVGKSCTALAFACNIDRSFWDVIWIHHSRFQRKYYVVWIYGTRRRFCVLNASSMDLYLPAILYTQYEKRKRVVFLDGYLRDDSSSDESYFFCRKWLEGDYFNRRLICICSMDWVVNPFFPKTSCGQFPTEPTFDNNASIMETRQSVKKKLEKERHAQKSNTLSPESNAFFKLSDWKGGRFERGELDYPE